MQQPQIGIRTGAELSYEDTDRVNHKISGRAARLLIALLCGNGVALTD